MLKTAIKKIVSAAGYDIVRSANDKSATDALLQGHTMQSGLLRAKHRQASFNTIIDVGAAAGTWTEKTLHLWPNADYLLIEPLIERKEALEDLKSKHQNIAFVLAVLGSDAGKVSFSVASDLDGSGVYGANASNTSSREVDRVALDELIKKYNKQGPYLLKLDTHGYEMPIFEGAQETLKNTDLIVVEVYGFFVSPHAILFYELCKYLDEAGFRPVDMVDVVNRKKDGAFWQCDIFFAPKHHPLFKDNAYA